MNTNSAASNGLSCKDCSTMSDKPVIDFLKSTGSTHRYTCGTVAAGRIIVAVSMQQSSVQANQRQAESWSLAALMADERWAKRQHSGRFGQNVFQWWLMWWSAFSTRYATDRVIAARYCLPWHTQPGWHRIFPHVATALSRSKRSIRTCCGAVHISWPSNLRSFKEICAWEHIVRGTAPLSGPVLSINSTAQIWRSKPSASNVILPSRHSVNGNTNSARNRTHRPQPLPLYRPLKKSNRLSTKWSKNLHPWRRSSRCSLTLASFSRFILEQRCREQWALDAQADIRVPIPGRYA